MSAFIYILCLISFVFSSHPWASVLSWLSLLLAYKLFWRPSEPKVIFFGLLFFWLTIPTKLFYADLYGVDYESLSRSSNIATVTYVSIAGFVAFMLGLYTITRNLRPKIDQSVTQFTDYYDPSKVVYLYIYVFLVGTLLQGVLFTIPGLTQILGGFIQLKLGFIFLLVFSAQVTKRYQLLSYGFIIVEILLSFFSIFSNFKDVLITVLVSITIFNIFNDRKRMVYFILGAALSGYMFLAWQSVKGDYRKYLTGGERSQVIKAERNDALSYLATLFSGAKVLGNDELIYATVDRISYIEFFAQSTEKVPDVIPHEGGKIWTDNVLHILMPRLFFPGKKSINDSEMVNKYCTQRVTVNKGATFSLGFMAESYIDFGWVYMYVPIFLLGLLFGYIYKLIIAVAPNYLWACIGITPLWFNIACNGTPGTKILGWLLTYFIALFLFRRFFMVAVDKMIRKDSPSVVS